MKPSERILQIVNAHKTLHNKVPDVGPGMYWEKAICDWLDENWPDVLKAPKP